MEALQTKPISLCARWFRLCPARYILCAAALALLGVYLALRRSAAAMEIVAATFVRPWHRHMSRLTSHVPFSVAEYLIVAGVIAALIYIVFFLACLLRRPEKLRRVYRFALTCLSAGLLIYAGFCLFWGVYYDCSDFEAQSGITAEPISTAQLETVTRYFTDLVNLYGEQVSRDENGLFDEAASAYFSYSAQLYTAVEQAFPCLTGDAIAAKPFFFSRFMSYANFTGFFFPFTAEANINIDSPACLVPATIAHELAHQRGVAQEDEANFVAVLANLTDGDSVYCYSACLLAYIHLGNALCEADYDAWLENYQRLSDGVRADLANNNAYWAQFETAVSTVSDAVYTGFLQSYGQTLGLQTYGKCVDLLVAYYYDTAAEQVTAD
ncbi:MAG: DUF3810 domain-containing protein [Oscillospiraceae bacterium]|nr:DUF3810 domain-containing protein [Oscillospiraceae bacterium]